MSGFAGVVCYKRKIDHELENIRLMTDVLSVRGGRNNKVKNFEYGVFGGTSLVTDEDERKNIPLTLRTDSGDYSICFDGLIYNDNELRHELMQRGISCDKANDAELVLLAYIRWGAGCLKKMNGVFAFAIWNNSNHELFMARDRFGIKPFYYTFKNDCLIFASEIKGLLAHPSVDAIVDRTGICEVMGLGPAQTQGCGIFKDIQELLPASCATFNKNGFNTYSYWRLCSEKSTETFEECLEHTKKLTLDAIDRHIESKGRNMCYFLSGGLDSSAIAAVAAQKYGAGIDTFSLRYAGNDEFFEPTQFQPASDDYFIDLMSEHLKSNHHVITIDNDDLISCLTDAVIARDLPGMADVDSSLLYMCKKIGTDFNGALSGECADEVFGGYPWFHRKEDFEANVFPWAKNVELRRKLIAPDLIDPDEISDYIYAQYNRSVAKTPLCSEDNEDEKRRREIAHLNLNWFMYTLGARSERIGMNCGLEIRMPFCDYKLVEHVWNVPWCHKAYKDREKGLLRMVFNDILPEEVLWRKKSPFPKTHNPEYEDMVCQMVLEILSDKNSPVCNLVNDEYVFDVMRQPSDYGKPWFGQLMATPQLYAYIIQLNFWLEKYKIKIMI